MEEKWGVRIVKKVADILFCHLFYRVKYQNMEILNKQKHYILCPNHSHILDPIWLGVKIENVHVMAKSELFKNKIIGNFFRYLGAFPVRREKNDLASTKYAISIVQKGQNKLIIFPEGGILKPDLRGKKIKRGAIYISGMANVPMIPVTITQRPKLFSKVMITFKEPMIVQQDILEDKERMTQMSEQLLHQLYKKDKIL